jgi:hypothetical protein
MIPLDVNTRWNALYLMMLKTRKNKGAIIKFARQNTEVEHLIPTESQWKTYEVMERVLEPFYDFTCAVSRDQPSLPETLGIIWRLDDLLDEVSKIDGQFGDVGNDIRAAFASGVVTVDHWMKEINDNIIYHTAAVLDPRVKLTLIREQYGNGAPEIFKRIKDYLKREY